jgi:hypothetical protein
LFLVGEKPRGDLISRPLDPDLVLFVVSWINPDLVVTFNPVAIFIMGGNPDVFPPLRDPDPVDFPMARRLIYYRRRRINGSPMIPGLRREDRRRKTMLEQVVKRHRPQSDGHSLPASPHPITGKGKGYRVEKHSHHQQSYDNPPFHDRITS